MKINETYEIAFGMQQEMQKQAAAKRPSLVQAAECLHSALEILEGTGLQKSADKVLNLLEKIAEEHYAPDAEPQSLPLHQLMAAGLTQRDLREFSKGSLYATAKVNLVLRGMGMSSYEMGGVIGTDKVMSEEEAQQIINPNETIELLSSAKKKVRNINKQADESPIFNLDADDDLLDADIGDDMLEVIDKRIPFEDFEDE
jgi:hypothetical protein